MKSKLISINKSDCNFLLRRIENQYFKNRANKENLAFAYRIAKNLKISNKTIVKALTKFKGLPHRQEVIFSNKYLTCVNDSKATSFDASLQCLLNYNHIYWIVGGLPKFRDQFYLNEVSKKIIKAYIIGKRTNFFVKQIGKKIPYKISYNIKNALKNIHEDQKNTKNTKCAILFSPASASFDQFKNFEDRGYYFKKLAIKSLKNT